MSSTHSTMSTCNTKIIEKHTNINVTQNHQYIDWERDYKIRKSNLIGNVCLEFIKETYKKLYCLSV